MFYSSQRYSTQLNITNKKSLVFFTAKGGPLLRSTQYKNEVYLVSDIRIRKSL